MLFAALALYTAPVFAAVPAAALTSAAAGQKNWPNHLRMLSGPNGGQWFMLGEPIAEVLSREVVPTSSRLGGGLSNINNINDKQADLGFSLACFMGAAESGDEEYRSVKTGNAALLANVYPQVLYFLVRKEFAETHGIREVGDLLKLKSPVRFASLKPGTASERIVTLLLKHGYNTNFEQLRNQGWILSFNNYAETADNFVAGDLDCFAYTAGTMVPLIKTMEEHTPVMILPLSQNILDMLAQKFKTGTYVIQPNVYKSVTTPLNTLGDYTCIIVRKDLPDDLVFAITKALWENKSFLANIIQDFGGFSSATALPPGLAAHPGAAKFWNSLNGKN